MTGGERVRRIADILRRSAHGAGAETQVMAIPFGEMVVVIRITVEKREPPD